MKWLFPRATSFQVLAAFTLLSASAFSARGVVLDNFENTVAPSPWVFSNGPEFPGATGSLTRATGHTGSGARLAFDIRAGGNYVGATNWLPSPVTAGALQLWVKHPGGVRLQVRVNDSTGQTLQYTLNRPFEATDAGKWYQLFVNFDPTSEHWGGGINDGVLHGTVTGVSILVQPTLTKSGTLDFDEVNLVPARSTQINPASAVAAPAVVTDLYRTLGVEITHAQATATGLDLAQWLGFRRVRTEMFWADVETAAGVYNFAWYDQLAADLKTRGLQPHFILCYGNPIYTNADWFQPPRTALAIQGFGNFARAAAAHFAGQGVYFEVWNEPDIATYWNAPSAAEYSALCQVAVAQVHAGDPTAPVVSGGLAGIDLAFMDDMVAAGAVNGAEAIGLHPYRLEIPEQLAGELAEARAHVAKAFPNNPPAIWSTEAGYSSAWYGNGTAAANRTKQAKLGVRQLLTGLGLGLPSQTVFCLADTTANAWDTEQNFGILDSKYQNKGYTAAMRNLMFQCRYRTFKGIMASPQNSTHIFKFMGSNDTMLAVWSESSTGATQTISFPTLPKQVFDYLGKTIFPTADGQGGYAITVTDAPVYVVFAGRAN